jgi:WD40 repeat protein
LGASLIDRRAYQEQVRPRRLRTTTPAAITPTFAGHLGPVRAVGFSPDGRWLVTGGDDQTVLLWDITDPTCPRPTTAFAHTSAVLAVAVSPDGHLLATGSSGTTAALWKI